MIEFAKDLFLFSVATIAWGLLLGLVVEALTEMYFESPLKGLRDFLKKHIWVIGKAQSCKTCWPLWIAVGLGVLFVLFFPKILLSTVLAAPVAWRVSRYVHDRMKLAELDSAMAKAPPEVAAPESTDDRDTVVNDQVEPSATVEVGGEVDDKASDADNPALTSPDVEPKTDDGA